MVHAKTMAGIYEPIPFEYLKIPKKAKAPSGKPQFAIATLLLAAALGTTRQSVATEYIFATFTGDAAANEKLSIYTSPDALTVSYTHLTLPTKRIV